MIRDPELPPDERALLIMLADCYNAFARLPDRHPADLEEATTLIHILQRIVMARVARRAHPEFFNDIRSPLF